MRKPSGPESDCIKMKRTVKIISVTGLVLLAVLTFVSRSIYNHNLPQVSAAPMEAGYVPLTYEAVGSLRYPNEATMTAGGAWTLAEVLVKAGDAVREGDPLCFFDTRASSLERQSLELDVLRLSNAIAALEGLDAKTGAEAVSKSRQMAEAEASLALAEARLAYAVSQAPPEDGLAAPFSGIVSTVSAQPGQTVYYGNAILSLHPDEAPQAAFSLPAKEGEPFSPGTLVSALIETVYRKGDEGDVFERQAVAGRVYSAALSGERWECRATLNDFDGRPAPGQDVLLRVTQQGEMHMQVVPLDCVFNMGAYSAVYLINTRSGIFGDEHYLTEMAVEVLYDNGRLAALRDDGLYHPFALLARNPSKYFFPGDVVWVRD